jgi:hypothetical protein
MYMYTDFLDLHVVGEPYNSKESTIANGKVRLQMLNETHIISIFSLVMKPTG